MIRDPRGGHWSKDTKVRLMRLLASGEAPSTATEIARALGVSTSTACGAISGLRRARMIRFVLTQKGRDELEKVIASEQRPDEDSNG